MSAIFLNKRAATADNSMSHPQWGLTSAEVDDWVRRALREKGTIYAIDEPLLRALQPDVILTQRLCDVCAVGYGTVAKLAQTLPGSPQVVNLEPTSLADISRIFGGSLMRAMYANARIY